MEQKHHTTEIDLGEEKTEKLISLLELVEGADHMEEAVWLSKEDRKTVESIRNDIESQTGL